jgi:hypothetical protein
VSSSAKTLSGTVHQRRAAYVHTLTWDDVLQMQNYTIVTATHAIMHGLKR